MKRPASAVLPIPVDGKLKTLIKNAAARTRLSQAELMRTALRIGVPEVVERLAVKPCGTQVTLRHLKARKHSLTVQGTDSHGNLGPAAKFRWRVTD